MKENNSSGMGFSSALTIAFIILKLTHVIDWSWIWVLSPIWISLILLLVIVLGFYVFLKRR